MYKSFPETRQLYTSSKEKPSVMHAKIRMKDLIDPEALRLAVDSTMQRYPYFCVELQKVDGQYVFEENQRPVVVANSAHGVELNADASNYHMVAFSWWDNWIVLDMFHGLTDGTGVYEVVRTLLYYYCSERYGIKVREDGIRLAGDPIPQEEWVDPVEQATNLPVPPRTQLSKAINPRMAAGLDDDVQRTVYSVAIPESEFMRFNIQNDGSPATMVSLFLCRAVANLYPDNTDAIRVVLCVNQRKALGAPLAHQSLVGGAMLEYKQKMRSWPVDRQATVFRGMVFAQTREEIVLAGVASQRALSQLILSKETEQERIGVVSYIDNMASDILTATVSYVGKADYKESENYIRDFRTWTSQTSDNILVEISAVGGRFVLDFMQSFSSPVYVNAFCRELDENGITYDLQDVQRLELPNIRLPWSQ